MDLWLDGFALFNFVCLSGDIALAHSENGFRVRMEYFPIWFSVAAAVCLFAGVILRLKAGQTSAWDYIGHIVGFASVVVGTAGVVYPLDSRFFYERTLKSLTYAAPFAGPMAFVGLGCVLIMNRMVEPRSKEWTRWVFFFSLGGFAGNFVLSLTDHAVNGFFLWAEWIPVASSAFAVAFLAVLIANPSGENLLLTAAVLMIQFLVGGLGFLLHLQADFHGPAERIFSNIRS